MRLLVLIPSTLPLEEIKPGIVPYVYRYLRSDTELAFANLEIGFPSIESELQGEFNATQVVFAARKAQEQGMDGVFVDCFDDPGVYACRESLDIPVFGAYVPAVLTALGAAERIGIITTDTPGILSEERKAALMGITGRLAAVRKVDTGVLDILADRERVVEGLTECCLRMYREDRAGAVCFGCTAMAYVADDVRAALKQRGCPMTVVEPLAAGLSYLEHTAALGITNSLGTGVSLGQLKWYDGEDYRT